MEDNNDETDIFQKDYLGLVYELQVKLKNLIFLILLSRESKIILYNL